MNDECVLFLAAKVRILKLVSRCRLDRINQKIATNALMFLFVDSWQKNKS